MSGIAQSVRSLLQAYRGLLDRRFGDRVHSVRLFGSRARGEERPDSDVDVAVVIRALTESERSEAIRLAFEAWLAGNATAPEIAPLVWSDRELADRITGERRIALDIEREGIAI